MKTDSTKSSHLSVSPPLRPELTCDTRGCEDDDRCAGHVRRSDETRQAAFLSSTTACHHTEHRRVCLNTQDHFEHSTFFSRRSNRWAYQRRTRAPCYPRRR